ncbi:MAG: phage tail tape measure protein, partial [Candidatus Omnitrophica bacterium]|nr:phage tail tape measure protein [Candidatus Omnitrophota bacterium]
MLSLGTMMVIIGANTVGLNKAVGELYSAKRAISATTGSMNASLATTNGAIASLNASIMALGRNLTMFVSLPVGLLGVTGTKAFADFEYSLSKITGLVGIAAEQTKEWGAEILDISSKYGKGPQELVDALYFITSSGFKGSESMNVLKVSAEAAAAGLGDTKDIANISTSALNAYGKSSITAAYATDVLTVAVREGKGEPEELVKAFATIIPIAAQLGVRFDEIGGALAAMTRFGIPAANASTYLRQTLFTLTKPSKQTKDGLAAIGLSAQKVRDSLRSDGLIATLEMLKKATNNLNEEGLSRIFPNIRAFMGVLSLTGKNLEETKQVFDAVANSTGATAEAFKIVSGTIKFKFNAAMVEGKTLLITFGEAIARNILPYLEGLLRIFKDVKSWFNGLSESTQNTIIKMALLTATIGPLILILQSLKTIFIAPLIILLKSLGAGIIFLSKTATSLVVFIGEVIVAFRNLTLAMALTNMKIGLTSIAVGLLEGNFTKAAAGFRLFSVSLLSSPVGWVIIGLTALAGAIYLVTKKTNELTIAQKTNKELQLAINDNVAAEASEIERLLILAKSHNSSYRERMFAIDQLNKKMAVYTGGIVIERSEIAKAHFASLNYLNTAEQRKIAKEKEISLQTEYNKGITEEKVATGEAIKMGYAYIDMLKHKYTRIAAENAIIAVEKEKLDALTAIETGEGMPVGVMGGLKASIKPENVKQFFALGMTVPGMLYNYSKNIQGAKVEEAGKVVNDATKKLTYLYDTMKKYQDMVFPNENGVLPETIVIGKAKELAITPEIDVNATKKINDSIKKIWEDYNEGINKAQNSSKLFGESFSYLDQMKLRADAMKKSLDELKKLPPDVLNKVMDEYNTEAMSDYYNNVQKIIKGQKILEESTDKANKARELQVASISGVAALTYKWNSANSDLIDSETRLALGLRDIDKLMKDSGGTFNDIDGKIELVSNNITNLKALIRARGWNVGVFNDLQRNLQELTVLKVTKEILSLRQQLDDVDASAKMFGNTAGGAAAKIKMLTDMYYKLRDMEGLSTILDPTVLAEFKKILDEIIKKLEEAGVNVGKLGSRSVANDLQQLTNTIESSLESVIETTAELFGQLAAGTITAKGFFNGLLESIMDMAIAVGKAMIALGISLKILQGSLNPAAMIIGGIALLAAGSAIKSLISKKASNMANGGIVPQGYPNDSYPARLTSGEMVIPPSKLPEFERQETQIKVVVEGITKGKDIHYIVKEV